MITDKTLQLDPHFRDDPHPLLMLCRLEAGAPTLFTSSRRAGYFRRTASFIATPVS